jgi:5-methyltetrahydrofolate--homocysteine methyltransferase
MGFVQRLVRASGEAVRQPDIPRDVSGERSDERDTQSSRRGYNGRGQAANVLLEKDQNARNYIETYAESQAKTPAVANTKDSGGEADSIEKKLRDAVLKGSKESIVGLAEKAVAGGMKAIDILNGNLIPAIAEVGDLYEKKIYFLPQLMMSAETVKTAFTYLEPKLREESAESKGKIVIATVKGDVHDIGKNIVAILLRNHGYDVTDLGKDVPAEIILEKAIEIGADVVGLSALMTTTMPRMQEFMSLLRDKGMNIPVLVGGAAVTKEFAESIGARYSRDAVGAVKLVGEAIAKK